jgi:hypothetical protein
MQAFLENLGITILGHVLSWDSRIMVVYAGTTLLIVFALWLYRGRPDRTAASDACCRSVPSFP